MSQDVASGGAEYVEAIAQKRAESERARDGWPFGNLMPGKYGAIYADPPWRFETWAPGNWRERRGDRCAPYQTECAGDLSSLPVADLAARDCALFVWVTWPLLGAALALIDEWGFDYKTCAFSWMKAHASQIDMFRDDADVQIGTGYWTRANSEACLLATRGKPKRLDAGVRQGIIEPRREHSRKPDCVPGRIERLVAGPYCELFARTTRPGWDSWGNEVGKFAQVRA